MLQWLVSPPCFVIFVGSYIVIRFSVGIHSRNFYKDVRQVQSLLNGVPPASGGPVSPLAVDGSFGAKTRAAIKRYQQTQFGWHDSVVDPDGPTIERLETNSGGQPARPAAGRPAAPPRPTPPRVPVVSTVTIRELSGRVEMRKPGSSILEPAKVGVVLQPWARVHTRDDGRAVIEFDSDGKTMTLQPGTLFIVYPQDTGPVRRRTGQAYLERGGQALRDALPSLRGE